MSPVRALLILPLAAVGCSSADDLSTHDGIADAQVGAMNDLAEIVGGIGNSVDLEVARPMIEQIIERMEKLQAAAKKLGEPGVAERKRTEEKVEAASMKLQPQVQKATQALQNDPETMIDLIGLLVEMRSTLAR